MPHIIQREHFILVSNIMTRPDGLPTPSSTSLETSDERHAEDSVGISKIGSRVIGKVNVGGVLYSYTHIIPSKKALKKHWKDLAHLDLKGTKSTITRIKKAKKTASALSIQTECTRERTQPPRNQSSKPPAP